MAVKIIGTSHIAKESESAIREYILLEKPDIVAVELDAARAVSIFQPQRKLKITDIRRVGLMGWLFAAVGSWLQRKLGSGVDMTPGADMRVAITAARQVKARVALIDRPIQLTLKRLSTEMSFYQKAKFFAYLLFGSLFPSEKVEFDLNKVPEEKLVQQLTKKLKQKFPSLYRVLVSERDEFIANQIKLLKSENLGKNILVVVGAGHLHGVKALLKR
ncbi:MAG: TraB/GumN family protein [archaeon]